MSLSFREEAAIHFFTGSNELSAVSDAQKLADAACARWGHHYDQDPKYYAATCHRCGAKTTVKK